MKKLLLLGVLFAFGAGLWAQVTQVTDGTQRETIRFRLTMRGVQLTYHIGGTGADQAVLAATGYADWVAGTTTRLARKNGTQCNPCDILHQVMWVENTGGVYVDINGYHAYTQVNSGAADHAWSAVAALAPFTHCPAARDDYVFVAGITAVADITPATHAFPTERISMHNHFVAATHVFETGIPAEDPANRGDGTWGVGFTDQRTIDIVVVLPPGIRMSSDLVPDVHLLDLVLYGTPTP